VIRRTRVSGLLLKGEEVLIVEHQKKGKSYYLLPGGGINEGESPKEALFRELLEEIGTQEVDVIGEFPEWITYDFPPNSANSPKLYPYQGQTQKYFLVRLKEDAVIDLDAHELPEVEAYAFVPYEEVLKRVTYFKRKVYRQVLEYFKDEGLI
jgi:putative (di)nucleoside polyphosphate hydrolase